MSVADKIRHYQSQLPPHVTLVAVSKFQPVEVLQEAYEAGQRVFGESREQELRTKHDLLPADIRWHFVGHLQTNKVKYIAPFISLIHSVDSERLLDEINRQALRNNRVIDVLLQLHIATEETKSGFLPDELLTLLSQTDIAQRWPAVRLCGMMGMASLTHDEAQIVREFRMLRQCYQALLDGPLAAQGITADTFAELSMGMSDDYLLAIEEGGTMVRIGSGIFGVRPTP